MKGLLLLLSLLSATVGYGQKKLPMTLADLPVAIDTVTGGISYVQIVEVPGASASVLYDRTKTWLVDSFQSAKTILDADDRAAGTLIAKPVFSFTVGKPGFLNSTQIAHKVLVDIRCKDSRYRCELRLLEYVPTQRDISIGASFPPRPIQAIYNRTIGKVRERGYLYEGEVLQLLQTDKYYRTLLEEIKLALSKPGKNEF